MSIASVVPTTVFGARNSARDSFQFLDDQSLVYVAGGNVVVYSPQTRTQKFVPASQRDAVITALCVTRERHYLAVAERTLSTAPTTALTSPDASLADAQANVLNRFDARPAGRAAKSSDAAAPTSSSYSSVHTQGRPVVHIYGLPTFRKRKTISVDEVYPLQDRHPKDLQDVWAVSFSADSKNMAIITADLFLSFWVWEKSRCLGTVIIDATSASTGAGMSASLDASFQSSSRQRRPSPHTGLAGFGWSNAASAATSMNAANVGPAPPPDYLATLAVTVNPHDDECMVVHARSLFRMFRSSDGVLKPVVVTLPVPESEITSFSWLSAVRFILGARGALHIMENGILKSTLPLDASPMGLSPGGPDPALDASTGKPSFHSPSIHVTEASGPVDALVVSGRLVVAAAHGSIYVHERNQRDHVDYLKLVTRTPIPMGHGGTHLSAASAASVAHDHPVTRRVKSLEINSSEECLLVVMDDGACLMFNISVVELAKGDALSSSLCLPSVHMAPITGMDICVRKSLIATASTDRSIRLWNFVSFGSDLCKYFPEEPSCVSFHPSGYYLLAGFPDKLRLMTILPDDLRVIREFPVRGCRECAFARGGHLFAAVQASIISIYDAWTFDLVASLKGHNGRIRSLYWTRGTVGQGLMVGAGAALAAPTGAGATAAGAGGKAALMDLDDARLVSCGADGAVYTWVMRDVLTRQNQAAAANDGGGGSPSGKSSPASRGTGTGDGTTAAATGPRTAAPMKRQNEYILKGVSFASAVDVACTTYAVGSDRVVRAIVDSLVVREVKNASADVTQITASQSGRMMFVGTGAGTVKAVRCPFPPDATSLDAEEIAQEHMAHAAPIAKLRVSFDDRYLVSAADDGCIMVCRITDRESATARANALSAMGGVSTRATSPTGHAADDRSSSPSSVPLVSTATDLGYADEVIVTKSDLEEKTAAIHELRTRLEELKMEHDYQLRLKDMHLQDRIKELTSELTKVIETLKISSVVLRSEKDKEEAKHKDDYQMLVTRNARELRDAENRNNQQLMNEYEKFQTLQDAMRQRQLEWEHQYEAFEGDRMAQMQAMTEHFETLLKTKAQEVLKMQEDMDAQLREFSEHQRQQADDIETEVAQLEAKYEAQLKTEREVSFRFKGENGIMKKKFLTLNKEIEDNKVEMAKLRDNENRLRKIMTAYEREVAGLKHEMLERDKLIQEQERRVYDLKKANQELEKYKFVLDHKIKDLKRQIEPREDKIADMRAQILDTNAALGERRKHELAMRQAERDLQEALAQANATAAVHHRRAQALVHLVKQIQTDLTLAVDYIQDPSLLKRAVQTMHARHCAGMEPAPTKPPSPRDDELKRQEAALRKTIRDLKAAVQRQANEFRLEHFVHVKENKALIAEIRQLQQIKASLPLIHVKNGSLTRSENTLGSQTSYMSDSQTFVV
ncbi:Cilia- and flagella-associated protein 57 [Allomyces arbusculus]|nr:Cilia- and flagella-associated protein 57 [Allomyces arbusculus]